MTLPTNTKWLLPITIFGMGIFYIDAFARFGVAGYLLYILLVLLSRWLPSSKAPIITAAACTILTYISMMFLPSESEWRIVFLNRSLAVLAMWITAFLLSRFHIDHTQHQQAKQRQQLQQAILEKIVAGKHSQFDIFNELCLHVEHIRPSAVCSIMLLDKATGTLKVGAVPSGGETACTILDGLVPGELSGACGTAVHTRTRVIIEDCETDPRWEPIREAARPLGIKSCWSIPIFGDNQDILGTFAISHPHIQHPTPDDFHLLDMASSLVGLTIQRHQTDSKQKESEERFRDLFESAPLAYFTVSLDGYISRTNHQAGNLLGRTRESFIGQSVLDLYAPTPGGREKAERLNAQAQQGKEILGEELEMQHSDGSYIWGNLTVRLIHDSEGRVIERRGIIIDITQQKHNRELQSMQKMVLEHMVSGESLLNILNTLCVHVEGMMPQTICSILTLNPQAHILQFRAGPSVPSSLASFLDGMKPGPRAASCGTATYRCEPVYVSDTATDPLWAHLQDAAKHHNIAACWSYPILTEGKQVLGSFAISSSQPHAPTAFDTQLLEAASCLAGIVMQRRETELALSDSEQRYRTLYEDNPSMYFTVALDGTMLSVNPFGALQLGYTDQELLGKPVSMLFIEEHRAVAQKELSECLKHPQDLRHWELQKIRKDGQRLWVRETARIVKDQHNQTVFLIVCHDITQEKQAEKKLQEIHMALSNAMPGIAQIDPEGNYSEVNESYADMLGYQPHELLKSSWEPMVHAENQSAVKMAYQKMLEVGKGEFEAKAIRKNGTTFYKHGLLVKKVDSNGELIGHHYFIRDISERKLSEEALKESEARFQDILDNSPAVIYVKDFQGRYLLINREYERIFNFKREEVKGKTDFDLFSQAIAKVLTDNDKKVIDHNDAMEWEEVVPHTDGLHTYISNKFLLHNAHGEPYAVCGISTDITQRKQSEMNIRLQNHILESSPSGILITDTQMPDNPIIYCNAAFEKMTGYTQDEILGRNCRFLQQGDIEQDGLTSLRTALSNQSECHTILRNYKKDGMLFWNELRLAPVFNEHGNLCHYIGLLVDITERKGIDDSLRMIAEATSTLTGLEFFRFLVKNLAICLNVQYGVMTDASSLTQETIRTLVVWNGTTFIENFDIPLVDSPCENVLKGEPCNHREHIRQRFPQTQILKALNVESYVGYPLFSQSGEILGHLVAMDTKPISDNSPAETIIQLFASRAAAELERNNSEKALQRSEDRLRQVIDLVPHFIFAKDIDGRFILCNRAVANAYGTTAPLLVGKTDADFAQNQEEVDHFRQHDLEVIHSGITKEIPEEQITDAEGVLHYLQTTKIPFVFADSTLPAVLGVSTDITARKSIEDALLILTEATVTQTGHDFYRFLVKNLATCLNVKYAFLTECTDRHNERLRTLAFWNGTIFGENFEFPIAGTPCEKVMNEAIYHYPNNVQQSFPHAQNLKTLEVESYVGYPLFSPSGEISGHLVAMDTQPLPDNTQAIPIIKLFAARAAAELDRHKAESHLREVYEQTRDLTARLEVAEESERKRIARELHDEFGQMLTGLKFDLSWIQRRLAEQPSLTPYQTIIHKTRDMSKLIDELIQTVRRIATSLRPTILDDLGLIPSLEWQAKDFQSRTGITCQFSTELDSHTPFLDNDRAVALFRITQELLTNILRHAEATCVKLSLQKHAESLTLSVHDNGLGFVEHPLAPPSSLGLRGIKERVATFGGEFLIQGQSGKGTQATIHIPLIEKQLT